MKSSKQWSFTLCSAVCNENKLLLIANLINRSVNYWDLQKMSNILYYKILTHNCYLAIYVPTLIISLAYNIIEKFYPEVLKKIPILVLHVVASHWSL